MLADFQPVSFFWRWMRRLLHHQFNFDEAEGCSECSKAQNTKQREKEFNEFSRKFETLRNELCENALVVAVDQRDIFSRLNTLIPCVGCRKSVEKMYNRMAVSSALALSPLCIKETGALTFTDEVLRSELCCEVLFDLFRRHVRLEAAVESIPRSKKNRCLFHSLENQKAKQVSGWEEVWNAMNDDCRQEVVIIGTTQLQSTVHNYLQKHKFCTECKSKVLRAFHILVKECEIPPNDQHYNPTLYEDIHCCPDERHIHLKADRQYIEHLVKRAEPELLDTRRERHAKTLDIAQEEVLTCIGVHMFDKLFRIGQQLRAEEQTWTLLFHLSIKVLAEAFELALEQKRGVSQIDILCEVLQEEERAKQQRIELRRAKKKQKKQRRMLRAATSASASGTHDNAGPNDQQPAAAAATHTSASTSNRQSELAQQNADDSNAESESGCELERSDRDHDDDHAKASGSEKENERESSTDAQRDQPECPAITDESDSESEKADTNELDSPDADQLTARSLEVDPDDFELQPVSRTLAAPRDNHPSTRTRPADGNAERDRFTTNVHPSNTNDARPSSVNTTLTPVAAALRARRGAFSGTNARTAWQTHNSTSPVPEAPLPDASASRRTNNPFPHGADSRTLPRGGAAATFRSRRGALQSNSARTWHNSNASASAGSTSAPTTVRSNNAGAAGSLGMRAAIVQRHAVLVGGGTNGTQAAVKSSVSQEHLASGVYAPAATPDLDMPPAAHDLNGMNNCRLKLPPTTAKTVSDTDLQALRRAARDGMVQSCSTKSAYCDGLPTGTDYSHVAACDDRTCYQHDSCGHDASSRNTSACRSHDSLKFGDLMYTLHIVNNMEEHEMEAEFESESEIPDEEIEMFKKRVDEQQLIQAREQYRAQVRLKFDQLISTKGHATTSGTLNGSVASPFAAK